MEHGVGGYGQRRRLVVVKDRAAPQSQPLWTLRSLEWAAVASVILVLIIVFTRQMEVLRGQAELASIRATLSALRTALIIDYVHKNVTPGQSAGALSKVNPFNLLQRRPVNYLGEMTPAQAQAAPPGSWVFDPVCVCVGYLPMNPQWFDSPRGDVMAWFELSGTVGPLQLTPKQAYVWQGQVMD